MAHPEGAGREETILGSKNLPPRDGVFLYSGFLYLLKWNPFWRWMPSVDFETRNKAEGFLILISTLFWVIATLRIFLRGSRIPDARSAGFKNPSPRREKTRRGLTLTDLILWYHSFHRK